MLGRLRSPQYIKMKLSKKQKKFWDYLKQDLSKKESNSSVICDSIHRLNIARVLPLLTKPIKNYHGL